MATFISPNPLNFESRLYISSRYMNTTAEASCSRLPESRRSDGISFFNFLAFWSFQIFPFFLSFSPDFPCFLMRFSHFFPQFFPHFFTTFLVIFLVIFCLFFYLFFAYFFALFLAIFSGFFRNFLEVFQAFLPRFYPKNTLFYPFLPCFCPFFPTFSLFCLLYVFETK